ncbi:hypothetical protein GOEFS_064_00260 [Gordonia effusa NBRC 100432]|uniref:Uncharacterized protein n=1 Tax=Gordonia effusa NBRC 100432 TaxID=1077974 RepID=H0R136_9ACTN|nr:hypothetical protein GOEFS_064_00260 [Gordonia effusa NBRC 100432]
MFDDRAQSGWVHVEFSFLAQFSPQAFGDALTALKVTAGKEPPLTTVMPDEEDATFTVFDDASHQYFRLLGHSLHPLT